MQSSDAITAHALSYVAEGHTCLQNVDVDIPWGAVTAICGPNGSGKTTLLELLAGVRVPSSGSVTREHPVALVLQRATVPDALPVTVSDVARMGTWGTHLTLTRNERRTRVIGALEQVHMLDLAHRPFTALSGGQRQRTLIAQGISQGARIFLLDEPATGLDHDSRQWMKDFLANEADGGAAVVLVTHDDEDIREADHIIRLDNGLRVDHAEPVVFPETRDHPAVL